MVVVVIVVIVVVVVDVVVLLLFAGDWKQGVPRQIMTGETTPATEECRLCVEQTQARI